VTSATEAYLHTPAFARLWQAARDAHERNGCLAGQALLERLTEEEAAALNGLLRRRRPLRAGGRLRLDLQVLDATLREFAFPLEHWLVTIGGALANRPAQREILARRDADLWAVLTTVAATTDKRLVAIVDEFRRTGLLKRLARGSEVVIGRQAINVLGRILDPERETVDLAVLAARVCGDAKSLNEGRPLTTIVLRALAHLGDERVPANAEQRRELWERYGVVCDPLSSHVLCLNLPVEGEHGLGLDAYRDAGEPMRLTLRTLRRFPLHFKPYSTIFVCENPTVVSAAAEALGPDCAPLVCAEGRPVVAVHRLLDQAVRDNCRLWYHGDFDWPGIAMAADAVRRYNALPWRLGAADYRAAIGAREPARRLEGTGVPAPWDAELQPAMQAAGLILEEEAVIADLLTDLADGVAESEPKMSSVAGATANRGL
jgi:uncharacterized protein (TIGR02679 family)